MSELLDAPEPKKKRHNRQPNNHRRKVSDGNLTPAQEAYARARAFGMTVEEAHKACDLKITLNSCKRNWEHHPLVSARIEELSTFATKNAIINTGLDREWVISRLMTVVERCMQAEPVMAKVGGEWQETGEYKFDALGANQALKMLGDTLGMFKPVEKKPGDEFAALTDDEIARLAQELAAQTGLLGSGQGTETQAGQEQT